MHTYIIFSRAIAEMEAKFKSNDEVRETEVRKLREELFALKTFKDRSGDFCVCLCLCVFIV